MFREHGCELPANAMFEHTNTRYPQALRCVRLPSELRKPIEKPACLATIVRVIAYLAGLEQTTGHRRSKAVACRIGPPFPSRNCPFALDCSRVESTSRNS